MPWFQLARREEPGHNHRVLWTGHRDGSWTRHISPLRLITCRACRGDWRLGSDDVSSGPRP